MTQDELQNMSDVYRRVFALEAREIISLRDQFAMAALTGCMARKDGYHNSLTEENRTMMAEICYDTADAMLAARKPKPCFHQRVQTLMDGSLRCELCGLPVVSVGGLSGKL